MKIIDFQKSDFWKLLRPPLIQSSKFNNFLWGCWFLGKNLSNFQPPVWKLHNPYCHTTDSSRFILILFLSWLRGARGFRFSPLPGWNSLLAQPTTSKLVNFWSWRHLIIFFKLADRIRSMRTNGASKNRYSWSFFFTVI